MYKTSSNKRERTSFATMQFWCEKILVLNQQNIPVILVSLREKMEQN